MSSIVKASDSLEAEQIALLRDTIAKGATKAEFDLFVQVCNRLRLDPFARQIFLVKRYDSQTRTEVAQPQVSIDGLRLVAERTGEYRGQTTPQWCGKDGHWVDVWLSDEPPAAARCGVYRAGFAEPLTRVAKFSSYVQMTRDKQSQQMRPNRMWATMPEVMLHKCFDEETEVLTDRGFERFSEVTGRVMQVTDAGLAPTDAKVFSQAYVGPMITLGSDDLNFSVTPNHDMVTTDGKIEAGAMFEAARTRPAHWIPRLVQGSSLDVADMTDAQIVLAAAYLCDGSDASQTSFVVSVMKQRKVAALLCTGLARSVKARATKPSRGAVRDIIPTADQQVFRFGLDDVAPLVYAGKEVDLSFLSKLSLKQARLFVDSMIFFDGNVQKKTGVRRFYTSRPEHMGAFELACVMAGYSISAWSSRISDIGTKLNYYATVSARDAVPVRRWGREYHGDKRARHSHTGLTITTNAGGKVWCVTVPSGVIVVRRHGFSMLCGNCAEALALRSAFPNELSGVYTVDEMGQANNESHAATKPARTLDAIADVDPTRDAEPADVQQDLTVRVDEYELPIPAHPCPVVRKGKPDAGMLWSELPAAKMRDMYTRLKAAMSPEQVEWAEYLMMRDGASKEGK